MTERYKQELSREISPFHSVMISLAGVTPAGSVFLLVPTVISMAGTGSILAMIFAAGICVLMAFCWAELGAAFPTAGGDYPLTYHAFKGRFQAFGSPLSFVLFALQFMTAPLAAAILGLGIAQYLPVIPWLDPRAVAAVLILVATAVAALNIRVNAFVTGMFLILELFSLAVLMFFGIVHFHARFGEILHRWVVGGPGGNLVAVPFSSVAAATAVAIYAYNGFNGPVFFSEETRGNSKGIAVAVLWSLVVSVVAELLPTAAVIFGAPDVARITASSSPMTDFVRTMANSGLYGVVAASVAVAVFNAMIVTILVMARTLYAAGRDGAYPGVLSTWMAAVHPRVQSPWIATMLVGISSTIMCIAVSQVTLIKLTGTAMVVSYSFVAVSALIARASGATNHGPYKMPWWPLVPILAILALGYVVTQQPWELLQITIIEMGIGLLWWLLFVMPRRDKVWLLKQPALDYAEPEAELSLAASGRPPGPGQL